VTAAAAAPEAALAAKDTSIEADSSDSMLEGGVQEGDIMGALPAAAAAADDDAVVEQCEAEPVEGLVDTTLGAAAAEGSVPKAAAAAAAAHEESEDFEAMPDLLDRDAAAIAVTAAAAALVAEPAAAAALVAEPAAAEPAAPALASTDSAAAGSSSSSTVSAAETAISDSFSLVSAAATDRSAFSGMTAGTAFTLQSSSSSGVSKLQEHLADSVLGGLGGQTSAAVDDAAAACAAGSSSSGDSSSSDTGAAAAVEGAEDVPLASGEESAGTETAAAGDEGGSAAAEPSAAAAVGSESMYASMYGSGLLLSAEDVEGAMQVPSTLHMSALPVEAPAAAAAAADGTSPAAAAGSSSDTAAPVTNTTTSAAVAPAAATTAAAAGGLASEPWQGDASLYASIIAHSEDHEQPGSPFNFGESFAAALSAAGLDTLSGPSPPSGSPHESGSEDWTIVEAAEGAEGPGAAAAAAGGVGQEGIGAQDGSSKGSKSWLGGRKA
jgi:hypothetical protein